MAVSANLWLHALVLPACAGAEGPQHYWPQARGDVGRYGVTTIVGPHNLSASLAWRWRHPKEAVLPGMALIDSEMDIYTAAMDGVYKFSARGNMIWRYSSIEYAHSALPFRPFYTTAVGSLVGDDLYVGGTGGTVVKLARRTGQELWKRNVAEGQEMDTPYIHTYQGVVMAAHTTLPPTSGNRKVTALNASSGDTLWEYTSEHVLWNFHPVYPGDDSFLTMDIHGGVYRMKVHSGERVWYTPAPAPYEQSFTDGGLILDADGGIYTCANLQFGRTNTPGALRKYRLEDGKMLWQRFLPQPCVSWPASDGNMVVVPVGGLPSISPPALSVRWLPKMFAYLVHRFSSWLGPRQISLWGNEAMPLSVHAFSSADGSPLWTYSKIPDWTQVTSRGDEEHLIVRSWHWPHRALCGPASWSAPTIGGDGTVYAGAMNGVLYAIRDANRDGRIDERTEVSTLDMGDATLHGGTSFAPGLMAFSSCAELLVFRW